MRPKQVHVPVKRGQACVHPEGDGLQVRTPVLIKADTEPHCFSVCILSLASVDALPPSLDNNKSSKW